MKTRWLAPAGIILLAAVLWLSIFRGPESVPVAAKAPAANEAPTPANAAKQPEATSDSTAAATELVMPAAVPVKVQRPAEAVAAQLTSAPEPEPGLSPLTVMQNMRSVFHQYNARFGGNPIGNNADITAALNGRNPGQVMFLNNSEDGLRVNEHGELVDNWGTPFFFHQISGTVTEIYSAGPDRKMWTSDDLVLK
jgi:hypothetical protein